LRAKWAGRRRLDRLPIETQPSNAAPECDFLLAWRLLRCGQMNVREPINDGKR